MRKLNLYISLLSCIWLMTSCQDQPLPKVNRSTQQAFDLVGFLDQQAQVLEQNQVKVKKTVLENGQVKESKVVSTLEWPQELGIFADADLNKPALLGLYDVQRTTNAQGQQVHQYTAKEDADVVVKKATYTLDSQGRLIAFSASMLQENFLFSTQKEMKLQAQPGVVPSLQTYSLDEAQTLLFFATERYGVQGEIIR